jgi:hypothetical protein
MKDEFSGAAGFLFGPQPSEETDSNATAKFTESMKKVKRILTISLWYARLTRMLFHVLGIGLPVAIYFYQPSGSVILDGVAMVLSFVAFRAFASEQLIRMDILKKYLLFFEIQPDRTSRSLVQRLFSTDNIL